MASASGGEQIVGIVNIGGNQIGSGSNTVYTVPAGRYAIISIWDIHNQTAFSSNVTINDGVTTSTLNIPASTAAQLWGNSTVAVSNTVPNSYEMTIVSGTTINLNGGPNVQLFFAGSAREFVNP